MLSNNASAGKVLFTYDDGPGTATLQLVSNLKAEHIKYAVFFMIGEKVVANPRIVRAVVKAGYAVEVHTWDHHSLTGASTHTAPLTPSEVKLEFTKTINALVAAGAPRPTMWRPPYGDADGEDILIAQASACTWSCPGRKTIPSVTTVTGSRVSRHSRSSAT